MIEVFRTNVNRPTEAEAMVAQLLDTAPDAAITFDLEDCDRVLRIESAILEVSGIISCMQANGYRCEILP